MLKVQNHDTCRDSWPLAWAACLGRFPALGQLEPFKHCEEDFGGESVREFARVRVPFAALTAWCRPVSWDQFFQNRAWLPVLKDRRI